MPCLVDFIRSIFNTLMEETLSFSAIKLLNEKIKIGSEKLYNTFNRLTNPF